MNWAETCAKYEEANFHQSPRWAKVNELVGAKTITKDLMNDGVLLAMVRDAKRGRYLEIPCGPVINWSNEKAVKEAMDTITAIAKENNCVFVRVRPQLLGTDENLALLKKLGFRQSPMHLAAEHTVIIDLTKPEDQLLAEMRRQTRYEIKQAKKQGIIIEKSNSEETFKEFHKVQVETAKRKGFIPPKIQNLLAEREAFGDDAQIYIAYTAEREPIAYGLILKDINEAEYFEAASTDLNRRLPGAYALIWQVIEDLKKTDIKRFNLYGIAPQGQPHHRYAGVTTFKTGFSNARTEYVPAHDFVISKFKYLKNLIVETIRRKKRHL